MTRAVKAIAIGVLGGAALATAIMLIPYPCCMHGPARGLPFTVVGPACAEPFGATEFNWGLLAGNTVVWTLLVLSVCLWLFKMRTAFDSWRETRRLSPSRSQTCEI